MREKNSSQFVSSESAGAVSPAGAPQEKTCRLTIDTKLLSYSELQRGVKGLENELARQKEVVEESRFREERLNILLDTVCDPMTLLDKDLTIIWANKAATAQFGAEIVGQKWGEVFPQGTTFGEPSPCLALKAFANNGTHEQETVVETVEGKRYFQCSAGVAMRDSAGEPTAVVEVARDITARKKAEQETRRAWREWERTFHGIGDLVSIQDAEMRVVRANKALCEAMNLKHDDLVGKYCYEIFCGGKQPCALCPGAATRQEAVARCSEVTHEKLGKVFWVTVTPIYDDDGALSGIVHVAKDITDTKQLEIQLRQSRKMGAIGTLAGGIAHDFNNILTAVIGFTELAILRSEKDSSAWQAMLDVRKSAYRARDLVAQILAVSRQTETTRMPVLVNSLVKEAFNLLRATLPSTIKIESRIKAASARVLADPAEIHQVLMNLCTNAFQAMGENGGVLEVSLDEKQLSGNMARRRGLVRDGRYLALAVRDTGHGLRPAAAEKVFEPLPPAEDIAEGAGPGLSAVHGIVKGYGGSVTVESEAGRGVTFRVYLPVLDDDSRLLEDSFVKTPLLGGKGRVLFVDDEESIARMGKQILEYLGYQVVATTSCAEAFEMFQAHPDNFDLVVTDQTMPEMTGLELAEKMLAARPDLPVILCSGYSEMVTEEKLGKAGIREHAMKPLAMSELSILVKKAMEPDRL